MFPLYRQSATMLGKGLSILIDILNPEKIVVGSIFERSEDLLREEMEAVMTETVDGINPGIVTSVMLKGYKYNDKVIRPAMVKVSE